jgi:phage shock protein E
VAFADDFASLRHIAGIAVLVRSNRIQPLEDTNMRIRHASVLAAAVALALLPFVADSAELTKDSLKTVLKNVTDEKAVLVDVREKSEWDRGHIEGAVFLPLSALKRGADAKQLAKLLPKDKILYTHCVVGKRAVTAGDILERFKYEVRPLKPGYKELLKAGFKKAEDRNGQRRDAS